MGCRIHHCLAVDKLPQLSMPPCGDRNRSSSRGCFEDYISLHCKLLRTVQGTWRMRKWEQWLGTRRAVVREAVQRRQFPQKSSNVNCNYVS